MGLQNILRAYSLDSVLISPCYLNKGDAEFRELPEVFTQIVLQTWDLSHDDILFEN